MSYRSSFLLLPLLIAAAAPLAAPGNAGDALAAAIAAARQNPGTGFLLEVMCTDEREIRSLTVFDGRVAVWKQERQALLDRALRDALLVLLRDADFAHFEPSYGGIDKPGEAGAPLRVSCRIHLELMGLTNTSVQRFEGEQSAALLGLADRLLDRIEPLAARGVGADGLEDGLAKLADGRLAPEVLELRLVSLPPGEGEGMILRMAAGNVERQAYTPGKRVGDIERVPLTPCRFAGLVAALRDAAVWELPLNLRRSGLTELEVAVLGHRQRVIARPGFPPAADSLRSAFDAVLRKLRSLPAADCAAADGQAR